MEMQTVKAWKRWAAFLLAAILFTFLTWEGAKYLRPQRKTFGSMWEQYLAEPTDSLDVLFVGSSIAYCDVIPADIWSESGIQSYVMAGPEQTIPISCAYIREACRTQKPQTVFLEMSGMFFEKYQDYTKANLSTMPFSWNRFSAALTAAEPEERLGICFPLYNYHYRWTEANRAELAEHWDVQPDLMAGYTYLERVSPQTVRENVSRVLNEETYAENMKALLRLRDFCEKRGIRLIPFFAPSAARNPDALRERLRTDLEAEGLTLCDLSLIAEDIGIVMETDWQDGLHLNAFGAWKFSVWLGGYLRDTLCIEAEHSDTALWESRVEKLRQKAGNS